MLIHCDRRATTKTGPFRPKAGTNMVYIHRLEVLVSYLPAILS